MFYPQERTIRLSVTGSSLAFMDYNGRVHYNLLHECGKYEETLDSMLSDMWEMMKGKKIRVICYEEFDTTFSSGYLAHYDNHKVKSTNPRILAIRDRLIKLNEKDI